MTFRRSALLLTIVSSTNFRRRDWIQPAVQNTQDGAFLRDNPEAFRSGMRDPANRVAATPANALKE